jgi:hypothetical protein
LQEAQIKAKADVAIALQKAQIDAAVKERIAGMQSALQPATTESKDDSQETQVFAALAQSIQLLAQATMAPRKVSITEFADDGTPIGASSTVGEPA